MTSNKIHPTHNHLHTIGAKLCGSTSCDFLVSAFLPENSGRQISWNLELGGGIWNLQLCVAVLVPPTGCAPCVWPSMQNMHRLSTFPVHQHLTKNLVCFSCMHTAWYSTRNQQQMTATCLEQVLLFKPCTMTKTPHQLPNLLFWYS